MKKALGLLSWLAIVLVAAALYLRLMAPVTWMDWAPVWSWRLAMAGLVVLGVYILSEWREIARWFGGRNMKYGSVAMGSVVVFLAILSGVNWISSRQNKRWDLTKTGEFELSDQTKKILHDLTKPAHVVVYYAQTDPTSFKDKLEDYAYNSKQFTFEVIDANREPGRARADKAEANPTVLVTYEGRTEHATGVDEQALTNALKKVIEGKAKKIYFVEGHNEHDITDNSSSRGYGFLAEQLKADNFDTAKLLLAREGKVPDDATVVVVAGPKADYLAPEVEALRVYLKKGGKLFLMVDPVEAPDAVQEPNLIALAKEWGVELGNNIVIDASGMGQLVGANAATPIGMPVGDHAITPQDFRYMTAFPWARSATPIEGGAGGHMAQKLIQTTQQSWAETDLKQLFSKEKDKKPTELNADKGDTPGPITLAAAVSASAPDGVAASPELPRPETRVVVAGDSDFLGNGAIRGVPGNKDLGLNMANWLAQQESLISIRAKAPEDRPLAITADQKFYVILLALAVVPLLLIGNGIRVWWRRR